MRIILDTNIIIRLANTADRDHAVADQAIVALRGQGNELCIVPQILYEYWVVATKPVKQNGLGMSGETADEAVTRWLRLFHLLRDERAIFRHWRELVRDHDVSGRPAHDARIAAAMIRHGIDRLLTFNAGDFKRYDLTVMTPAEVLA